MKRCGWCGKDEQYIQYHDQEWGVPVYDDHKLFEFLILEGAQAGLSWLTILRRREGYRRAFSDFHPEKVARYGPAQIENLLRNPDIIRNNLKIRGAVTNAQAFLRIQEAFGSFAEYSWRFVDGRPIVNRYRSLEELPAYSSISKQFSRDLKQRGFTFVGPTIIYAHMQAVGMVNDHLVSCFRHKEVQRYEKKEGPF